MKLPTPGLLGVACAGLAPPKHVLGLRPAREREGHAAVHSQFYTGPRAPEPGKGHSHSAYRVSPPCVSGLLASKTGQVRTPHETVMKIRTESVR